MATVMLACFPLAAYVFSSSAYIDAGELRGVGQRAVNGSNVAVPSGVGPVPGEDFTLVVSDLNLPDDLHADALQPQVDPADTAEQAADAHSSSPPAGQRGLDVGPVMRPGDVRLNNPHEFQLPDPLPLLWRNTALLALDL